MTEEDLAVSLKAILGERIYDKYKGQYLPRICNYAAQKCFINDMSENEHTARLREALQDLKTNGYFKFETVRKEI